jgi:MFS family permease
MLGVMTDLITVIRSAQARDDRPAGFRRAGRPEGRAPRPVTAPRALLAIVLTGQFMAVLDASVVNVAAPAIHAELHASGAGLQLVIAGYVITYAVLLVTGARLGDIVGHRRMFLAGLAAFTLASLGCGLATSTAMLVALRFIQGAGAAAMIPQVLSLIQRTFTGTSRAGAMRLYAAVIAGGAVAGQVAGGLLVTANLFGSGWRAVFLVNVPIGVALLATGARMLPHGAADRRRGLDPAGLALLTPAAVALVLPLVLGQSGHWPVWGWICLAGSVLLFGLFAVAERRLEARGGSPLIPGRVLSLPGVAMGVAALFVTMAVFGGFFFALALHLQGGLGDTPLRAGLIFAPSAATFALVSLNWQRLPRRLHGALIIAGFAAYAAGLLCMAALLHGGGTGGVLLYLALGLTGAGMAAAFSPLMTAVLMRVPVADAADATGVVVTVNQLAIVIGVATFGTLYLNQAGPLPSGGRYGPAEHAAFTLASAHAVAVTFSALAAVALAGGILALIRALAARPARPARSTLGGPPLAAPAPVVAATPAAADQPAAGGRLTANPAGKVGGSWRGDLEDQGLRCGDRGPDSCDHGT